MLLYASEDISGAVIRLDGIEAVEFLGGHWIYRFVLFL